MNNVNIYPILLIPLCLTALIVSFYKRHDIINGNTALIKWLGKAIIVVIIGLIYNALRYGNSDIIDNIMQVLLFDKPASSGLGVHGVASFGFLGYWCVTYGIGCYIFSRNFVLKKIPQKG